MSPLRLSLSSRDVENGTNSCSAFEYEPVVRSKKCGVGYQLSITPAIRISVPATRSDLPTTAVVPNAFSASDFVITATRAAAASSAAVHPAPTTNGTSNNGKKSAEVQ